MFSCKFSEISKSTFFTEYLRTTAFGFSFSEAGTGGVLRKKVVLENFAKFTGKHLWFVKFSRTPFLQNTSATATLQDGALPTVFGKPQMNTLYLETLTLEAPFRYIIFSLAA